MHKILHKTLSFHLLLLYHPCIVSPFSLIPLLLLKFMELKVLLNIPCSTAFQSPNYFKVFPVSTFFKLFLLYLGHSPGLFLLRFGRRRLFHCYFMDGLPAPDFPKHLRPQSETVVPTPQEPLSLTANTQSLSGF